MKDTKLVTVTFTAGWGDGSVSTMNGVASKEDLETLNALEKKFPELITVIPGAGPVSIDIVDYTRWWICGGNDDILEKLYDLNVDKFSAAIRKDVAPLGHQSEYCIKCSAEGEDIHHYESIECPVTV